MASVVAAAAHRIGGGEAEQAEAEEDIGRNIHRPQKRAIFLTAFLACLSFVLVGVHMIVTFAMDVIKDEDVWQRIAWGNFSCPRATETK